MALSQTTRRQLAYSMRSMANAKEVADGIDANTLTMSAWSRRALQFGAVNVLVGKGLADNINASTALSNSEKNALATMMADRTNAVEIATAIAL